MPSYKAPNSDFEFLLKEYFNLSDYADLPGYADAPELVTPLLDEAARFCEQELQPLNMPADAEGVHYEDGKVTMPQGFREAYRHYVEGGWPSFTCEPDYGGQGLPEMLNIPVVEMICSANLSFGMTAGLSHGAYTALKIFGTEEQKQTYLPKIVSGEWSGIMCLTEPQAGTDLGLIRTQATDNRDGSYSLEGGKIFISQGEHDLTENIVHLVLARLPDAPEGVKGISLFVTSKFAVNDDGSIGEMNAVRCEGVEEKMGLHASPTCVMQYNGCRAWLVGEPHKGLKAMFTMMNEARQFVGLEGFAVSTAAYLHALNYARERIQGKDMTNPKAGPAPIIVHPDVRRQLMTMKAYVEGMRSIIYYTGRCWDQVAIAESEEEKKKISGIIEVLTPIVKGYITDKALEVTSHAVQVFGGYGYTKEYPVEQLMRDCRIFMIYEGTNGIQAMDLLGRKLGMNGGKTFMDYLEQMRKKIQECKEIAAVKELAISLEEVFNQFGELAIHMGKTATSDKVPFAYAYAHPFLESLGDLTTAWMLLWRAGIAAPKLEKMAGSSTPEAISAKVAANKDAAYYDGQLKTARFFINSILPVTMGKMNAIKATDGAAVEMADASFGG